MPRRKNQFTLYRKKTNHRRVFWRWFILFWVAAAVALFLITGLTGPQESKDPVAAAPQTGEVDVIVVGDGQSPPPPYKNYDKAELAEIIGDRPFQADEIHSFAIQDRLGQALFVRTTLDPKLQDWALNLMPTTKSHSAALVVMEPGSGRILTMASWSEDERAENLALSSSFPAASLFKIVTAAAAVESGHLKSQTTLAYDGGKYTLYKKNISGGIKEGSHQVTLKKGFAHSINTVFGKLGAFTLGKEELESFAEKFHFNQNITFEMPVESSVFDPPSDEDLYRLAELASGFNRTTKVSPLHGAMLASAVVNGGTLMEPTVVQEVFDLDNQIYYRHQPVSLGRVVAPETVKELKNMMEATVREGTGRRRFRDAGRHKVLSKLEIGGKSGTINNEAGQKVDWFVSFAEHDRTGDRIALASVVVHKELLGTRSQEIVREAIIHYFLPRI